MMDKKHVKTYPAESQGVFRTSTAAFRDMCEAYDDPEDVLARFEKSAGQTVKHPKATRPMKDDARVVLKQARSIRKRLVNSTSPEDGELVRDALSMGYALATMYLRAFEHDAKIGRKNREDWQHAQDVKLGTTKIEREAHKFKVARAWWKLHEQQPDGKSAPVDRAIAEKFQCSDRTVRRYIQWVAEYTWYNGGIMTFQQTPKKT